MSTDIFIKVLKIFSHLPIVVVASPTGERAVPIGWKYKYYTNI